MFIFYDMILMCVKGGDMKVDVVLFFVVGKGDF